MSEARRSDESAVEDASVLTEGPEVRVPVFLASIVGVPAMAAWAIVAPAQAESVIGAAVGFVVDWFGWF